MAEAVFFDLWNTLLYCPTRGKVGEIITMLGLEGRVDYHGVIEGMDETIFIDRGYGVERFFKELCSRNNGNCSGDAIKEAAAVWRSRLEDADYFPEAETVLADLGRDYKLGLISNVDGSGAEYAREKYLKDYFTTVIMSCEAERIKPDPLIYELGLEELGVKAGDSWMVGDNLTMDVTGALDAGLNAVLIDRRGTHASDEYPVIHNLSELRGIIE